MKFEYTTSYIPVSYESDEGKRRIFKGTPLPSIPNPDSLLNNPEYHRLLRDMGDAGWELVGVQPLVRAAYAVKNVLLYGGAGVSAFVTAEYYFFCKHIIKPSEITILSLSLLF